jgi:hypothetical protein
MRSLRSVGILSAALLLATLSAYVLTHAQANATRFSAPYRQTQLPPGTNSYPFRYWDKQFLITYSIDDASPGRPGAILYDRSGRIAREVYLSFKDAYGASIGDVAVSGSGQIVVAGGTESPAGVVANFIASIGDDGRVRQVIRTTPFLPVYVCAAEDGTVWSYGYDRDEKGEGIEGSLMLRQYAFGKGQLRAMLDKFRKKTPWWLTHGHYPGEIDLRCTSDRVGLFQGAASEYVEFDLASNKLKVSTIEPLPPANEMRITGFALTESGDVFISLHDRSSKPPRSGLFRLSFADSGRGNWVPIEETVGPYLNGAKVGQLLGSDGVDLVYSHGFGDGTAYWSKYSK